MIFRLVFRVSMNHNFSPALQLYRDYDNPADLANAAAGLFRNDLPGQLDCARFGHDAKDNGWLCEGRDAVKADILVIVDLDYDDQDALNVWYYGEGGPDTHRDLLANDDPDGYTVFLGELECDLVRFDEYASSIRDQVCALHNIPVA